MIIKVKVTPGAKEEKVIGFEGDLLKVKVRAKAEGGKANQAVISLLANHFKLPKREIILKSGATSRLKLFEIPIEIKSDPKYENMDLF